MSRNFYREVLLNKCLRNGSKNLDLAHDLSFKSPTFLLDKKPFSEVNLKSHYVYSMAVNN